MNRNDVIDVLTAVAAGDRRTVGDADVQMWGSVISHLPKNLALEAVVMHFRERPGVWLEPGHVVSGARAIARDLDQRKPLQLGPARQEGPVAAAYDAVGALGLDCPACAASSGDYCRREDGSLRRMPCPKRIPYQEAM